MPLGVLKPGAAADVIVMDYKPFTPFSDENIDGHMLFGMTGRQCQTTIINGKMLMQDREFVGIDEEAVNAHILESSQEAVGRAEPPRILNIQRIWPECRTTPSEVLSPRERTK